MSQTIVIHDVSIVLPEDESVASRQQIMIEDGVISEIGSDRGGRPPSTLSIDGRGLYAIPGLIDCHVHVTAAVADIWQLTSESPSYAAGWASRTMKEMLRRGFTTVRDTGGADFGLAKAVDEGFFRGPRLIYGGKALSQTGGHGDARPPGSEGRPWAGWNPGLGRVCDGVSDVRAAVRDEVRRGASHIKLMLSGGCASLTDRIDALQFSDEEVSSAVEEARQAGIYCAGHAYTAEAVARALELGVRTIEHGNLIDEATARLFGKHSAFYVPTMVTYEYLAKEARDLGFTQANLEKVDQVRVGAVDALRYADEAGADIALGTDLLGPMQQHQSDEFSIRAKVQTPGAILRSATQVGARLLQREDLGSIAVGKRADVVLVNGNPLADVELLARPLESVLWVLKDGAVQVSPR